MCVPPDEYLSGKELCPHHIHAAPLNDMLHSNIALSSLIWVQKTQHTHWSIVYANVPILHFQSVFLRVEEKHALPLSIPTRSGLILLGSSTSTIR